jgi:hypothetical protein
VLPACLSALKKEPDDKSVINEVRGDAVRIWKHAAIRELKKEEKEPGKESVCEI